MVRHVVYIMACLFAACSTAPTVIRRPDGSVTTNLGFSVFEQSATESALVVYSDGTRIEYSKTGKDQTKVVNQVIRTWGTVAGAQIVSDAMTANEAVNVKGEVAKGAQQAGVEKARVAADVQKTAILNPLE